ncbi:late blight resistance homolog R1B-14 [Olea europaea subsp. europaea]|uniref:Late blight resistance homolog R1B-14 n=1 Tax=Olea europaea subsp. europaea TaxID=158383 RepID=A0A8S0SLA0_OLEEU|nr:late blight resistance homolog R1B-14 [Olea europaea subsp. europaea]
MLSAENYHLDLQKVMAEIDTIIEEVMKIKDVRGKRNLQTRNFLPSRPAPSGQTNMVGFAQDLTDIRERLCDERRSNLQFLPIVGMAGMDKLTVTDHVREEDDELLKEYLYKSLKVKRYLIVMDDVRSIEVWNDIKMLFPDDKNGSRIILTSSLKDVADYEESWELFHEKVFGKENCPLDLVDVGTKIAKNCQGLPLLIVVIGGLLSKVNKAKDFWENVAENLSSIVAKEDPQFLERLTFSYKYLPAHLKECFLYMGAFPENCEIPVSRLIKLWVAEGFLKPHEFKPLEEVAQVYLGHLIDRNLILVRQNGSINGKGKTCIIHGLLRELCVRMAHKEEFLFVKSSPNEEEMTLQSMSLVRSFIYTGWDNTHLHSYYYFGYRLLRVLDILGVVLSKFPDQILQLVNLRIIAITCSDEIPPSIAILKNLQTLVVEDPWGITFHSPEEIFNMLQLRHLKLSGVSLLPGFSSPLMDGDKSFILENLQTLSKVKDLGMSKHFHEKIPNVKKLGIIYNAAMWNAHDIHLQYLETLKIFFESPTNSIFLRSITSAPRLKKITLERGRIDWDDMTTFGTLPNLELLKLREFAFVGPVWIPTEGEFLKLKFLLIRGTDLVQRLEHLILQKCSKLEEIPSDIGGIQTLEIIEIDKSSPSVVKSAMDILEEQRDQGNEFLEVLIHQTRKMLYQFKFGIHHIDHQCQQIQEESDDPSGSNTRSKKLDGIEVKKKGLGSTC